MLIALGSSPHTRGAPKRAFKNARIVGIIPAYAGSTFPLTVARGAAQDHPRIRGEHELVVVGHDEPQGSSPHTRGALGAGGAPARVAGIIPAYAGSTRKAWSASSVRRDHPRIRGEHDRGRPAGAGGAGSSPHTRGAPPIPVKDRIDSRIIPAYAGSTPGSGTIAGSSQDHPRIRGEHGLLGHAHLSAQGSSPHTRGAPGSPRLAGGGVRIIPAYAGSTSGRRRGCQARWDHPRIRGEHAKSS